GQIRLSRRDAAPGLARPVVAEVAHCADAGLLDRQDRSSRGAQGGAKGAGGGGAGKRKVAGGLEALGQLCEDLQVPAATLQLAVGAVELLVEAAELAVGLAERFEIDAVLRDLLEAEHFRPLLDVHSQTLQGMVVIVLADA